MVIGNEGCEPCALALAGAGRQEAPWPSGRRGVGGAEGRTMIERTGTDEGLPREGTGRL